MMVYQGTIMGKDDVPTRRVRHSPTTAAKLYGATKRWIKSQKPDLTNRYGRTNK